MAPATPRVSSIGIAATGCGRRCRKALDRGHPILLPSNTTTIPPEVEDGIGESADDPTGNYGACRGSVLLRTGI